MRISVLGSGSGGNAVVVESAGRRLLVDVGFSCRQIGLRLETLGVAPDDIDAILLTHEHSDHCRGLRVLSKKLAASGGPPIHATEGTQQGIEVAEQAASSVRTIRSGQPFEVAGFRVEPFGLPHDAREPVGFAIEDDAGRRLGLVGDLGSLSQRAWARLHDLDALILESNHDVHMLRTGPYPWALKQRVAGRHGHLANHEAAAGLRDLLCDRLRLVVLYHLSRTNNSPALAAEAAAATLDAGGCGAEVVVSQQDEPTHWLDLAPADRHGTKELR
ncbi:MAG: MBL fold metallo-hydrolase [Acidobacteriota bacterium]